MRPQQEYQECSIMHFIEDEWIQKHIPHFNTRFLRLYGQTETSKRVAKARKMYCSAG